MLALQTPDINRENESQSFPTKTSQGCFFTLTPSDAVPLSAATLLAVAHVRWLHGETLPRPEQLRLREVALKALNAELEIVENKISDDLIVAVIIMAMYEMIHGQKEFYSAHMHGLVQMIQIRGGLADLGMDGVFQRLVLMFDSDKLIHLFAMSNLAR